MPKRFFSFGCSFTAFAWPTWPDIVALNFPDNYYNFGRSGSGTNYLMHRFIEADSVFKFNKDDLIIIQWPDYMREDRYRNGWWHTNGSVVNGYPASYIKEWVDNRGFLIRDLTIITAITRILDSIGCEYHYLTMNKFSGDQDVLERFAPVLEKMKPSYIEILGPRKIRHLCGRIPIKDLHPVPSEHYQYLEAVLPQWLPENKNIGNEWDELLAKHWYTHKEGWDYTWDGIDRGFAKLFKEL